MGYLGGYGDGYPDAGEGIELPSGEFIPTDPEMVVLMNFRNPRQEAVWHDLSEWLRSSSLSRGRSNELDDYEAGTATIVLDNRDGSFDADNPDGPFYGQILPFRGLKLAVDIGTSPQPFTMCSSPVGGTDVIEGARVMFPLFTGRTGPFEQSWDPGGRDAVTVVTAVDAFDELDQLPTRYQDLETDDPDDKLFHVTGRTGKAVLALLDRADWPGDYEEIPPQRTTTADVDRGTTVLLDQVLGDDTVLSGLRKVSRTEDGAFFIGKDGAAVFRAADVVTSNPTSPDHPTDPIGLWGDGEGELPYHDLRIDPNDANIVNVFEATVGEDSYKRDNSFSIARYGRRSRSIDLLTTADPLALLDALLARYSEPRTRVTGLKPVNARKDPSLWRTILTAELTDRVDVRRRPMYGGEIDHAALLEGISIQTASKFQWDVDWSVSERVSVSPNLLTTEQSRMDAPIGWNAASGCTVTRENGKVTVNDVVMKPYEGSNVMMMVMDELFPDEGVAGVTNPDRIPVTPSTAYVFGGVAHVFDARLTLEVRWYNAAGTLLSTSTAYKARIQSKRKWSDVYGTVQSPVLAAYARPRLLSRNRTAVRTLFDAAYFRAYAAI